MEKKRSIGVTIIGSVYFFFGATGVTLGMFEEIMKIIHNGIEFDERYFLTLFYRF